MAVIKVLVCVLVALVIVDAAISPLAYKSLLQSGNSAKGRNCVCMNWRNCDGEINSDYECSQSYIMVCCIRPKPEPIPEYVPEVIQI